MAYTPIHKLRPKSETPEPLASKISFQGQSLDFSTTAYKALPKILATLPTQIDSKSPLRAKIKQRRKSIIENPSDNRYGLFNTEVIEDLSISPYRYSAKNQKFSEALSSYPMFSTFNSTNYSPSKLTPSKNYRRLNSLNKSLL